VAEVETSIPANNDVYRKGALEGITGFERMRDVHRTFDDETVVIVKASNRSAEASQNLENFNCIATRNLPVLLGHTGEGSPSLAPTQRWADAVRFTLLDPNSCGYEIKDIDWRSILDIQSRLEELGTPNFNAVLDRTMSADEQLQVLARKVRAQPFISTGQVTFMRDERRPGVSALFNRRNRIPDRGASGLAMRFPGPDDNDAVEISWFDEDNDYRNRTYTYPEGSTPRNALRVELTGATRWEEVWRAARYEYAVLQYRRRSQPVRVTLEGQLLDPFDRIAIVNPWDEGTIDGEVLGVSGSRLLLSQPVPPLTDTARIRLRSTDGRMTDLLPLLPNPDGGEVVELARMPAFAVVAPSADRQVGTLFVLTTHDAAERATRWIVSGAELDDNGATLTVVDDDDRVYSESDDPVVPEAPPILETY
jgi:hypothetical protein